MVSTPSERTVESLSNHGFLDVLNHGKNAPPFAWFLLPTQVEEYFLGYDADLAAHKRLYIQYKRMSDIGRFDFGFRQLWVMAAHLKRHEKPYVVLAGNVASSYADIGVFHSTQGATRHEAFNRTFFLDAWDVIQKVCEAVYGGGPISLPKVLPIPPAKIDLGFLALSQKMPGLFDIDISRSGKIVSAVTNLLGLMNFSPAIGTMPVTPLSTPILGWGRDFAEATKACHYGKPVDGIARPIVMARWRETLERSSDDEKRRLRQISVLTLPMI